MAAAKAKLDETSGVELSLSTDDEPDDGDYLASAEGTLIADPPAFEGEVAGRVMGIDGEPTSPWSPSTATSTSRSRSSAGRRVDPERLLRTRPRRAARPRDRCLRHPHRDRGPRGRRERARRRRQRGDADAVHRHGPGRHRPQHPSLRRGRRLRRHLPDRRRGLPHRGRDHRRVLLRHGRDHLRDRGARVRRRAGDHGSGMSGGHRPAVPPAPRLLRRCGRVRRDRHLRRGARAAGHDGGGRHPGRRAPAGSADRLRLPARVRRDAPPHRADRRPPRAGPGARGVAGRVRGRLAASRRSPTTSPPWWSAGSCRAPAAAAWCRPRWRSSPRSTPSSSADCRSGSCRACRRSAACSVRSSARWCSRSGRGAPSSRSTSRSGCCSSSPFARSGEAKGSIHLRSCLATDRLAARAPRPPGAGPTCSAGSRAPYSLLRVFSSSSSRPISSAT